MQRGFVMVMLLAIVAVLSVVLSVLLISNKQSAVIAIRESEEMKARTIGELCLSKGIAVAVEHFRQRGGEEFDFDGLLDPDGIPGNGDDYVFTNVTAANTRLYVPTDAEASANASLYRYSFERFDPDGTGPQHPGGCYLRFDDNADDNLPGYAAQTGNNGLAEGLGINVNNRDRDASIVVTAIGIYPALASTLDVDAYEKAHARVTLKQYFSATAAPAIYGNGEVRIAGNSEFCGSGGVRGVDVTVAPSSCICGDGFARSINGSTAASSVDECGPTRCPLASATSVNDVNSIPTKTPFNTEFVEQCLVYSETLGENPSTFRIEDPTNAARSPTVAPDPNNGSLRLHLRSDGAVFVWDGRNNTNPLDQAIADTGCAGFGDVWPPSDATPPNKAAVCATVIGGDGLGGFYCPHTVDPYDIEICQRDAVIVPADPLAVPPTPASIIPSDVSTQRCDKLVHNGTDATSRPNDGNTPLKDGICEAMAPGSLCQLAAISDPVLAQEKCVPPGSPLNCNSFNPNAVAPLAESIWPDIDTDITAIEAATCFPNGRRRDGTTLCTPGSLPVLVASQLCWRMVAKLDGVVTPPHNANGAVEWEASSGGFRIPVTTVTSAVPNMRVDTTLLPSNLATMATETVLLQHVMRAGSAPVSPGVSLRYDGATGWSTETPFNNGAQRRLPVPTNIFIAPMPSATAPLLTMAGDLNVVGVSWHVDGDVAIGPGPVTLGGARVTGATATTVQNYGAGSAGCSIEGNGMPNVATAALASSLLSVSGSVTVTASPFTAAGRIGVAQGLLVDAPADTGCIMGGISAGGVASGCVTGACGDNSVCFENRVGVIGSIMADGDLSAPGGLFAQRSGSVAPNNKITQLISRQDICIHGSSRIVGQIISEKIGGIVDVGPDLLMLQSGEVGVGFATKKTTWTDSSW